MKRNQKQLKAFVLHLNQNALAGLSLLHGMVEVIVVQRLDLRKLKSL